MLEDFDHGCHVFDLDLVAIDIHATMFGIASDCENEKIALFAIGCRFVDHVAVIVVVVFEI